MASIKLKGDTSGEITISSPSVAGTNTLELQATSGTLATTAQASIGMKNLIINGNMNIAQRATSVTGIAASNIYRTIDRWRTDCLSVGTWTQTQDTDVPSGQGFAKSLKMDCTTANGSIASNGRLAITHRIEGFNVQSLAKGTPDAKSITLSFWIKSNKTGTYIAELFDSDNTRQVSSSYTVSVADTWEKKTITYAGDTSGVLANDNGIGLIPLFWFAAGSDFNSGTLNTSWGANVQANRAVGQVNLADSTSNYINITGVQLEASSTATPFQHLQYGQQLALCQRYYYVIPAGSYGFPCPSTGGFAYVQRYDFKVSMRASPTMNWNYSSSGNIAAINLYSPNVDYVTAQYVGTGLANVYWNLAISTADSEL